MGAIGEDGIRVINDEVMNMAGVTLRQISLVEERERTGLDRRVRRFRGDQPRVSFRGRTVIIVDDGIATGSTARAACQVARAHEAARVVLAVPVAPPDWAAPFRGEADELVCVATPEHFNAIGQWYTDFSQTSDEEVLGFLMRAARPYETHDAPCVSIGPEGSHGGRPEARTSRHDGRSRINDERGDR